MESSRLNVEKATSLNHISLEAYKTLENLVKANRFLQTLNLNPKPLPFRGCCVRSNPVTELPKRLDELQALKSLDISPGLGGFSLS